jgi:hypothetical protein
MSSRGPEQIRDLPEALRQAVERTFAATAGSASASRGRVVELLNEVARRGTGVLDEVRGRGTEAREAIGEAASALLDEVEGLRRRVAELEARAKGKPKG